MLLSFVFVKEGEGKQDSMYQISLISILVRQGVIFAENENKDKQIERDRYFSTFYLK